MLEYFIKFGSELFYGWNFIVSNAILCICISYLFNGYRYKGAKNILIHIADLLVTYGLHLFLNSFAYMVVGPIWMGMMSWPILIFAHAFVMNKMTLMDRLMKAMTFTSFTLLLFPLTSAIGILLSLWNENIFLVIPIILICVVLIKRYELDEFSSVNAISFVSELIMFLAVIGTIAAFYVIGMNDIPTEVQLIVCSSLYVVSCTTCIMYYQVAVEEKKAIESNALAFKSNNDYQVVKLTMDNIESLKKMRHDMRSQYQYMRILLKNKDYEALDKFFNDMLEDSFAPLNFVNCGNNAVSGVINMELPKAKEANIQLDHSLLVPSTLNIPDFELMRFLTNIIDNAIEATFRDQIENARVSIKIQYQEPFLFVTVTNPIAGSPDVEKRMIKGTSKEDKKLHGYGKKIINEIIQKYHGESSTKIEDNVFIYSAMLRLEKEDKGANGNA